MEAIYKFDGFEDIISGNTTNKQKFELFVDDLEIINKRFNYSIYLYGSYISYLQHRTTHRDINFLILGEKIIEIKMLVNFLSLFHTLAKQYNIIYDISYGVNLNIKNLDFSGKRFNIIRGDIQLLYPYKNMIMDGQVKFKTDLLRFGKSQLFHHFINAGVVTPKVVNNSINRTKFPIPIKII